LLDQRTTSLPRITPKEIRPEFEWIYLAQDRDIWRTWKHNCELSCSV